MHIAVIDDLQEDREKAAACLETYFKRHYTGVRPLLYRFESGEEFFSAFPARRFSFVLIDYYLKGMSGMEIARKIREVDSRVILIFITTSRDYAIDGYKVMASGYLLKPFGYDDFEQVFSVVDLNKIGVRKCIEISSGRGTIKILLRNIIYCDIGGHYVQIHICGGEVIKSRMSFDMLKTQMGICDSFVLCYRGCMINLERVENMEEFTFLMDNGEHVPFRRRDRVKLKNIYSDFLFEKVRNENQ